MNTPSSALSDEMKGAMSTLLNAVIFLNNGSVFLLD